MRGEEFERLYEEHARAVYRFLAYRTGAPALAEDLLADTFERALKARRGFDRRKASERTWLFSIALNLVRDHARRQSVETRAVAETAELVAAGRPPDPLHGVELRDELERALRNLAQEEREVVALRFGADLTLREIASVTGQRSTTVEGRLYRALGKLRNELGGLAKPGDHA